MQQKVKQTQQGFFNANATFIEMRRQKPLYKQDKLSEFEPKVLKNHVIMKLIPQQIDQKIQNIPEHCSSEDEQQSNNPDKSPVTEEIKFPYELYSQASLKYQLIYSKYEGLQFRMPHCNFAGRTIKIYKLDSMQQNNYVALKNLDINDHLQNTTRKIIFDSRFQSGNLMCVYASLFKKNQFDCFIESDTNTYGYNQRFYFSVSGLKAADTYTFRIMNFKKKHSFFDNEKKIILFSMSKYKKTGNGWSRIGSKIKYERSSICDQIEGQNIKLYRLTFSYQPQEDNDYITLSSQIPYSYSRLISRLKQYEQIAKQKNIQWELSSIANTLSNNQVPYLKIFKQKTNSSIILKAKQQLQSIKFQRNYKLRKPVIIILARQHPGQTNSSFLMEQVLLQLAHSSTSSVQDLLEQFQFRIFPMINVDGVIYGNYRCDIAGFDLNRTWSNPDKYLHPQIWAIKQQIKNMNRKHEIVGCFDLHSHSSKTNVFSYSCNSQSIESKLFAFIFSKISQYFNFKNCTFGLSPDKLNTARSFLFEVTKDNLVATIQCSSYGFQQKGKINTLLPFHFTQISDSFLRCLQIVLSKTKERNQYLKGLRQRIAQQNLIETNKNKQEQISGSDSDPEADQIDLSLRMNSVLPNSRRFNNSEKSKKILPSNCIFNSSLKKQSIHIKKNANNTPIITIHNKQRYTILSKEATVKSKHHINEDLNVPTKLLPKKQKIKVSKSIKKIQFYNTLSKSIDKYISEQDQNKQIKINLAKSNRLDSEILKLRGKRSQKSIKNSIMSSYLLFRDQKYQKLIFDTPFNLRQLTSKSQLKKQKQPILLRINRNRCITSFRNAIITQSNDDNSDIEKSIEELINSSNRHRSLENHLNVFRIQKLILSQAKYQVAQSKIRQNIRQNLSCLRKGSNKKKKLSLHNLLMIKGNNKLNNSLEFPSLQ